MKITDSSGTVKTRYIFLLFLIILFVSIGVQQCAGQEILFISEEPIQVVNEKHPEDHVWFGNHFDGVFRVGTETTLTIATPNNRYYFIGNICREEIKIQCYDMGYYLLWIYEGEEEYQKPNTTIIF